jgi:hypothetical protein
MTTGGKNNSARRSETHEHLKEAIFRTRRINQQDQTWPEDVHQGATVLYIVLYIVTADMACGAHHRASEGVVARNLSQWDKGRAAAQSQDEGRDAGRHAQSRGGHGRRIAVNFA